MFFEVLLDSNNFGTFDYIDKQDDDAVRHVIILPLYALSLLRSHS